MTAQIEACHQAVGTRIRMIREAVGMSQEELAKRVGYKRVSITNIETGRQRMLLHTIEELARALNTTPKHLLRGVWW